MRIKKRQKTKKGQKSRTFDLLPVFGFKLLIISALWWSEFARPFPDLFDLLLFF